MSAATAATLQDALFLLEGLKLPCDVRLPPATLLGQGCDFAALIHALHVRTKPEWADAKRYQSERLPEGYVAVPIAQLDKVRMASVVLSSWLVNAQGDEAACAEFKRDVADWLDALPAQWFAIPTETALAADVSREDG